MALRLLVQNIPQNFLIDQFRNLFIDFNGFKDCRMLGYDELAYIEFSNYESADQAKKFMQNYKIPGTNQYIDFMPNNDIMSSQQYSANPQYQIDMNQNQQNLIQQQQSQHNIPYQQQPQFINPNNYDFIQNIPSQGIPKLSMPQTQNLYQQPHQQSLQASMIGQNQFMHPQDFQSQANFNPMINYLPQGQSGYKQFGHAQTRFLINKSPSNQSIALFKIPSNATNSLYVDGIPIDAQEREVSRKSFIKDIFRPFPGFIGVRLIKKISQQGREFYFCFIDFENSLQSTIAMDTVQNYRFHKNDKSGLKITFANEPKDHRSQQNRDRNFERRNRY